MSAIESYVHDVLDRIAPGVPGRGRIEADLRSHLEERVTAGEPAANAVARMGDPGDVARSYLEGVQLAYARWTRRLGAFLLDVALGATVVLSLAFLVVVFLGPLPTGEAVTLQLPVQIALVFVAGIVFVLVLLYFPAMEALFGQTVGKRVFGVSVAHEGGERVGWRAAIVRRLPMLFDFWPVDAAFLFFTKKRQRAFDIVARTIVIETGRQEPAWTWTVLAWLAPILLALAITLGVA